MTGVCGEEERDYVCEGSIYLDDGENGHIKQSLSSTTFLIRRIYN